MRRFFAVLGAAAAQFGCSAHANAESLSPSSGWSLEYQRDSCALIRSFGHGPDQVTVNFIRYEPDAKFTMHLIGNRFQGSVSPLPIRVRFGENGKFVNAAAAVGSSDTGSGPQPTLFTPGARLDNLDLRSLRRERMTPAQLGALSADRPDVEASVRTASIAFRGKTTHLLLGSMTAPMNEMRKCTSDLVKEWGLDPVQQESLASRPRRKAIKVAGCPPQITRKQKVVRESRRRSAFA